MFKRRQKQEDRSVRFQSPFGMTANKHHCDSVNREGQHTLHIRKESGRRKKSSCQAMENNNSDSRKTRSTSGRQSQKLLAKYRKEENKKRSCIASSGAVFLDSTSDRNSFREGDGEEC